MTKREKTRELFGWALGPAKKWLNGKMVRFSIKFGPQNRAGGGLRGSRWPDLAGRLPVIGRELEEISRCVEPLFLRVGEELQEIHSGALELTQEALKSVELIGGQPGKAVLPRVRGLAEDSLKQLETYQEQVSWNLRHTEVIAEKLDDLYRMCEETRKISAYLRVVGLNIGIESSRSVESTDMFGVVVEEIRGFSEKVTRIADEICDDAKAAKKMQTSARGEMNKGLDELGRLGWDAKQSLKEAVTKIEALMESSRVALSHAGHHSQEIAMQVGRVVVEIQFQDNMNQRIDHITHAFNDVVSLCREAEKKGESRATARERLNTAHSILTLQAAQLKQVISEIEQVHQNASGAFDRIATEVTSLAECLSHLRSDNGKRDAPFISLKKALDHLEMLLDRGRKMAGRIEKSVSAATETATRLAERTKYVRGISYETRLMAINAVIKAVHLGKTGMTLEVLAQEVNDLSRKTSMFAERVEELIDPLVSLARELINRLEKRNGSSDPKDMAPNSPDTASLEISEAYEQFNRNSSEALTNVEGLKNAISRAASGLIFLRTLRESMAPVLGDIEEIVGVLRFERGKSRKNTFGETSNIRKRYTMEHEREVHERTVGYAEYSFDAPSAPSAAVSGTGQAGHELRCDAELSQDVIGEDDEGLISGSELSGEPRASVPESPDSSIWLSDSEDADATEDLGDNVELF